MLLAELDRLPEDYQFSSRERERLVHLAQAIRLRVRSAGAPVANRRRQEKGSPKTGE
jgi:hypothetical protein